MREQLTRIISAVHTVRTMEPASRLVLRYVRRVQLSKATIAITGATGFLGGYLVEGLRAHGAHVIAVVRDRDKAKRLLAPEVEVRGAELGDRAALARSFEGATAAVSNPR